MSQTTDRPIIGAKPLADFTLWELAQTIALASDQAQFYCHGYGDQAKNVDYARLCFAVRNDCVEEIRDREQRGQT